MRSTRSASAILGVDEHRDEAAEEHAASVEATTVALRQQRRISVSVCLDTGLSWIVICK